MCMRLYFSSGDFVCTAGDGVGFVFSNSSWASEGRIRASSTARDRKAIYLLLSSGERVAKPFCTRAEAFCWSCGSKPWPWLTFRFTFEINICSSGESVWTAFQYIEALSSFSASESNVSPSAMSCQSNAIASSVEKLEVLTLLRKASQASCDKSGNTWRTWSAMVSSGTIGFGAGWAGGSVYDGLTLSTGWGRGCWTSGFL